MQDSSRTIDEAKTIVKEFCEARNWDQFHNPRDLAFGMATENSELLHVFRFKVPCISTLGFQQKVRRFLSKNNKSQSRLFSK